MATICIYCKLEKRASDASVDHVMPQAYGTFANAPTIACVCSNCNNALGTGVELPVARASGLGLMRYALGLKKPEDFTDFRKPAVRIVLTNAGIQTGLRMHVTYDQELRKYVLAPLAQVGFKRKHGPDYEFFLLNELDESITRREDLDFNAHPSVCLSFGDREEIRKKLAAIRITATLVDNVLVGSKARGGQRHLSDSVVISEIDAHLKRIAAKVAFNYLAYHMGSEFILDTTFDKVRHFIRYGTDPGEPMVWVSMRQTPVDKLDDHTHLVMTDWDRTGMTLGGWIVLFNAVAFAVALARPYHGIYRHDVRRCQIFDWEQHKVMPLTVASGDIWLPPSYARFPP